MSETTEVEAGPVTKVARDLSAILDLYGQLPGQAINDADSPMMPGGRAMVALAPVANHEAWENMSQATERYGKAYTFAEEEDPDEAWPAFQLIAFWSEAWRAEHGAEYGQRANLPREVNFLRYLLDWAWDNEPHFEDFARDVNRARVKLEDVLFAGARVEKSRVVCPECDGNVRLIVLRGATPEDDSWKCRACKSRYDQDEVGRAHAKMLRSAGAERWVPQRDAIDILKGQGNRESTVRGWLAEGDGEGYCDPVNHEVWVWWPALWRRHLMDQASKVRKDA
jgi:hypothetical protein